jgi:hypothetical protein
MLVPGKLYRLNSVCSYTLTVIGEHRYIYVHPGNVAMILRVEAAAPGPASDFVVLTLLLTNGAVGTSWFWSTSWECVG